MKRSLLFILCSLLFVSVGAQNTKVRFGIKGGININEFSFSGDDFKKDNRAGFFVGPTLTFGLPVIGLGAEICGLYDYRTVKINGESIDQKTLDVPLNVRYTVGFSETACAFLAAIGRSSSPVSFSMSRFSSGHRICAFGVSQLWTTNMSH